MQDEVNRDQDVVCYKGLRYRWHPQAFLSRAETAYALERLWELSGGTSLWSGRGVVEIPAVDTAAVHSMFDEQPGEMPWVAIHDFLPAGSSVSLDSPRLPAVCWSASAPQCYSQEVVFPIDIVALTFLMLSRWEEVQRTEARDCHGRVPLASLLAYRQHFHDRPVVDEWALVLAKWLHDRYPQGNLRCSRPSIKMTHDVDRPIRFRSLSRVLRGSLGELLVRSRSPTKAMAEFLHGLRALRDYEQDPYFVALRDLMQLSESLGLRGAFYLMTAERSEFDDGYDCSSSPIQALVSEIQRRGHEVGWHPGYLTAEDGARFKSEKHRMDNIVRGYGGRHHYLRWTPGVSWERWADHGLTYDSSLGFAEAIGFRCGTSKPFPVFSLARQKQLSLIEHPLLVMDCALERECAGGADPNHRVSTILRRAFDVGGEAVVLIHNSYTNQEILAAIVSGVRSAQQGPFDRQGCEAA